MTTTLVLTAYEAKKKNRNHPSPNQVSFIVIEVEKLMCQQRHEKSNDIGKRNTITVTIVCVLCTRIFPSHQNSMKCTKKKWLGTAMWFSFEITKRTVCGNERECNERENQFGTGASEKLLSSSNQMCNLIFIHHLVLLIIVIVLNPRYTRSELDLSTGHAFERNTNSNYVFCKHSHTWPRNGMGDSIFLLLD